MKLRSVIRFGIGSAACASLLIACGDGRGGGKFKAYEYSQQEMAENKAKADSLNPSPAAPEVPTGEISDTNFADDPFSGSGTDTPAGDSATPVATGDLSAGAPADSTTPATTAPAADQSGQLFSQIDQAAAKQFEEEGQAISTEPEQQVAANSQQLSVFIDEAVANPSNVNQAAASLIKGITIIPGGSEGSRFIDVQAIVVLAGQNVLFDASAIPVKLYSESVPNFLFTLKKPCTQEELAARNSLWAVAKCADESCAKIQLVMSFDVGNDQRAAGVFVVEQKRSAAGQMEWQITATNVGRPKTFVEAQATIPACSAPSTSANPNAGVSSAVVGPISTQSTRPQLSYGSRQTGAAAKLLPKSGQQVSYGARAAVGTLEQKIANAPYHTGTLAAPAARTVTAPPAAARTQAPAAPAPALGYGSRRTSTTNAPTVNQPLSHGVSAPAQNLRERTANAPYNSPTGLSYGARSTTRTRATGPAKSFGTAAPQQDLRTRVSAAPFTTSQPAARSASPQ